jgi:MFS family permease
MQPLWNSAFLRVLAADFCIFASMQIAVVLIPLHVKALGGSESVIGIVSGGFMLAAILSRPPVGWMADVFGRKPMFMWFCCIFAVAACGLPFLQGIAALLLVRILQGACWGGMVTAGSTLQSYIIPSSRLGEGIGYVSSVRNLAHATMPALGLVLADRFGAGDALWLGTGLALLSVLAVAMLEDKTPRPALRPKLRAIDLVERSAILPGLLSAAVTFLFSGMVTFVPLDAQRRDIGDPALFFVVYAVLLMVIRPAVGRWADRIPNRSAVLLPGLSAIIFAAFLLAFLETPYTLVLVACFWAFGFGSVQPVLRVLVLERAPRQRWGAANATSLSLYDMGLALGPPVLGLAVELWGYPVMYCISAIPPIVCVLVLLSAGIRTKGPQ